MKSTDNHINSPMSKIELDIPVENIRHEFRYLDQDFYDLIPHDLNTIYICRQENEKCYNVYRGNTLIKKHQQKDLSEPDFVMGVNSYNEFIIYMTAYDVYTNSNRLEEIFRFNNPDDAIAALMRVNHVGNYTDQSLSIYNILTSYIEKEISIHEAIMGLVSMIIDKNTPGLQYLNERAMRYGVKSSDRDLPKLMKRDLRKTRSDLESYTTLYADLYDVFVLYNFFSDIDIDKVAREDMDLAKPVQSITDIFNGVENSTIYTE